MVLFRAHGIGSSSAISRSNSRKKIAIRKNCSDIGSRAFSIGENPHSYGDSFCRSGCVTVANWFSINRTVGNAIVAVRVVIMFIITSCGKIWWLEATCNFYTNVIRSSSVD